MRSAIEGVNRARRDPFDPHPIPALSWPSRARCFGVWGYALGRAYDEAKERRQKVYVYKGVLNGESVWVTALDPKRATR